MAKQVATESAVRVEMWESLHGPLMPVAILSFDQEVSHRLCKAAALRLAALVEELSTDDKWCVTVGGVNWQGAKLPQLVTVSLELATGSQDEANRGVVVLGQAVSQFLKSK